MVGSAPTFLKFFLMYGVMMKWTKETYLRLLLPFEKRDHRVRVLTQSRDKAKNMLAFYADARTYQQRLDDVATPWGWTVEYDHMISNNLSVVKATVTILGVPKSDYGDSEISFDRHTPDKSILAASGQAFKRACSAFGLGRYLYATGQVWVDAIDGKKFLTSRQESEQIDKIYSAKILPYKNKVSKALGGI